MSLKDALEAIGVGLVFSFPFIYEAMQNLWPL